MIVVQTLGSKSFVLNAFLIQKIECLPDTTITLVDGKKIIVKDDLKEVIARSIDFFKSVYQIDYKSQYLKKTIEGRD